MIDGIANLVGVSGSNPPSVPPSLAASAVNRKFRGDENTTRLPFRALNLTFETEADRILFEGGNFQGAFFYNSYPSFLKSQIVCGFAGTIYRIEISGKNGQVYKLFEGNDPTLRHLWFAQGFDWLVIQNGFDRAILWDGVSKARRSDETEFEVPTGSVMAFIHGRLAVASADGTNQIAVGDIVYGDDVTTTNDIIRFTETQYWAEGGAFGVPVYVGDITGMYAMPYLDTGTGQNELVVLGTEGAVSIDLSRPRTQWLDSQLLRISLIGGGCVSPHSLTSLNGDLFFRSSEGIRSYKNARAEFQQSWKQTPISEDVRRWIRYDRRDLLEFNSQVSWNNYLFSTCSPLVEAPNNPLAGFHRFHRGFVVMDCAPESNSFRQGAPAWNGLWTGIRPTQFVDGRVEQEHRCFAFSYDKDGVNRLYEIERDGFEDYGTNKKKIISFFDTSELGSVERTLSNFERKEVKAGNIELSELHDPVQVEVSFRPNNSPCFTPVSTFEEGCECKQTDCFTPIQPTEAFKRFGLDGCKSRRVRHFQARVQIEGYARVDRLWFEIESLPKEVGDCSAQCPPSDCCPPDFLYSIVDPGVNPNVPFIPDPSDVTTTYSSIKTVTVQCPEGSVGESVTKTATESSTISQADADAKASKAAFDSANAELDCKACAPENLIQFVLNNSSEDLSAFFESGLYANSVSSGWRLIDGHTMTVYGSGLVDGDGTLLIVYAKDTGDVFFDPVTKIITDTTGTSVPIYLQVGCPTSGDSLWPDIPPYA